MPRRVIAIVTDSLQGPDSIEQIRGAADGAVGRDEVEVRVVVPAVETNPLRHTLGDVDEPRQQAEEKLSASLELLQGGGVQASGEVGDPDPIRAAQDALLKAPADEILIFERADTESRWYEDGLFEKAQEQLEPPLRLVVVEAAGADDDRVVEVETVGAGTKNLEAEHEVGSAYVPNLSRGDFAGMVVGVVGTIVAIVLAAAVASKTGSVTGGSAAAILIAIGIALVNTAHVVGLTLFETVRYRGGFAKMFRTFSLVGTPLAVLANLLILILS
ncbi:MAG: hypothetical protein H0X42_03660 [Solirubrobacterales bacterium]|nr:hypothetical protein [Solirubrobacterales bacterium]